MIDMRFALAIAAAIIFLVIFSSTSYAFYFSTSGGYRGYGSRYSNYGYGYSSNVYYPSYSYSGFSGGYYYSNPFSSYRSYGFGYPQRTSASFLFRSW